MLYCNHLHALCTRRGLGKQLRSGGTRLGVYVIPGTFSADRDKFILGTNITLGTTLGLKVRTTFKINEHVCHTCNVWPIIHRSLQGEYSVDVTQRDMVTWCWKRGTMSCHSVSRLQEQDTSRAVGVHACMDATLRIQLQSESCPFGLVKPRSW